MRATSSQNSSSVEGTESTICRSARLMRCGEMYAPTLWPCACRSAEMKRVVDVLPLVPTTWMVR